MTFQGARIVIVLSFLVHFIYINTSSFFVQFSSFQVFIFVTGLQSFTYLCYPMLGWVADRHYSRYSVLMFSMTAIVLLSLYGVVSLITGLVISYVELLNTWRWVAFVAMSIPLAFATIALGMFEANAIQFGMHQMLEANSYHLSTFIHWYYWSIHASRGLMVLVSVGVEGLLRLCLIDMHIRSRSDAQILPAAHILLVASIVQGVMATIGVYLLQHNKKNLNIDPPGHTPLTTVYKVLQYAWKHKHPENRSALTYWENDIPPRIDLGKSKYGGPFTTEEVEDVKTLFHILFLLLSLFGLHLSNNGTSTTSLLMRKLCPSAVTFLLLLYTPNIFCSASIVVFVPLLHYVILPYLSRYIPNMIHRMGLCLALILVQEIAQILFVVQASNVYNLCPWHKYSLLQQSYVRGCYLKTLPFLCNGTCKPLMFNHSQSYSCAQGDYLFLWLLLPIALRSFSYQFAFMTALEFICAQAPLRVKGLLIGLWYTTSAQQIHSADRFTTTPRQWLISHGIKCFMIFFSLLLYCFLAKRYRYRVRDEVVPIHFMIEERYEKEIRQREEYERERGDERSALLIDHASYKST